MLKFHTMYIFVQIFNRAKIYQGILAKLLSCEFWEQKRIDSQWVSSTNPRLKTDILPVRHTREAIYKQIELSQEAPWI